MSPWVEYVMFELPLKNRRFHGDERNNASAVKEQAACIPNIYYKKNFDIFIIFLIKYKYYNYLYL